MRPDGRSLDLFAWVTLANGDETSFVRADTQAVAGRLNRTDQRPPNRGDNGRAEVELRCWPSETTRRSSVDLPSRYIVAPSSMSHTSLGTRQQALY